MLLRRKKNIHDFFWGVHSWVLHPWRLTWNIIMEVWKIIFLSKLVIYIGSMLSLPGCILWTSMACYDAIKSRVKILALVLWRNDSESGQTTIIPKTELRGSWENSPAKPHFGVTPTEVAIVCPAERLETGTPFWRPTVPTPAPCESSRWQVQELIPFTIYTHT